MYDIVFLSYNEANADAHWDDLVSRFPMARRSHGVKGIVAAHKAAAMMVNTKWFWVVDGDNRVDPDFNFNHKWPPNFPIDHAVMVYRARNNVNGLVYGYGGVKLLPKRRLIELSPDVVDMTTSIGDHFQINPIIASTTVINATPFEAWKSGFRECAKLASSIIIRGKAKETEDRLQAWTTIASGEYSEEVLRGANAGKEFGETNKENSEQLKMLNDFDWLVEKYEAR